METNQAKEGIFFSQGKLLLSGEYFVLDGATAFAVPTHKGQHLQIAKGNESDEFLHWESFDHQENIWFESKFDLKNLSTVNPSDSAIADRLSTILKYIQQYHQQQGSSFFSQPLNISARLDFDRHWGFGSSSTLINNLAQWSGINPFELGANTFGGSGYDLACAQARGPIFYKKTDTAPQIQSIDFHPPFIDQLFLVWLGKKQDSRDGIATYKKQGIVDPGLLRQVSQLSMMMAKSADLSTFCSCIQELERLTGDYIDKTPLQEKLFAAMPGAVKSLGAWGGDFALLATPWSKDRVTSFCEAIGLKEVFSFSEIVLTKN